LAQLEPTQTIVKLCQWQDLEVEVDEMWSFVGSKKQQRWLWHAIDHGTGKTLAYVLSNHQDSAFLALKTLLEPLALCSSTLMGGCYEYIDPTFQTVGKTNTQTIERKHLTLRTGLSG